jgi:hypothetical protein
LNKLEHLRQEAEAVSNEQRSFGIDVGNGFYLQFESEPGFDLKIDSLEYMRSGIELLAVKESAEKTLATCFVPEGKLTHFIKLVSQYLENDTPKGKPRNQRLIDSISDLRKAALEALWMDDIETFPIDNEEIWWEIWLRVGNDREAYLNFFKDHASQIGLQMGQLEIQFPERTVIVAKGTKEQMSQSINLLNSIAELRRAKETAEFFMGLTSIEQYEWVDDALQRLNGPSPDCPAICILDTGINNQHPLLRMALDDADMHTVDPVWNISDHPGAWHPDGRVKFIWRYNQAFNGQ